MVVLILQDRPIDEHGLEEVLDLDLPNHTTASSWTLQMSRSNAPYRRQPLEWSGQAGNALGDALPSAGHTSESNQAGSLGKIEVLGVKFPIRPGKVDYLPRCMSSTITAIMQSVLCKDPRSSLLRMYTRPTDDAIGVFPGSLKSFFKQLFELCEARRI
jgi:hypothetical protein